MFPQSITASAHRRPRYNFRNEYGAIVLAIQRGNRSRRTGLESVEVEEDDVLLIQGTAEQLESLDQLDHTDLTRLEDTPEYHLEERLTAAREPR